MFAPAVAMLVLALFAAVLMVIGERRQQADTDARGSAAAPGNTTRPLAPVTLR